MRPSSTKTSEAGTPLKIIGQHYESTIVAGEYDTMNISQIVEASIGLGKAKYKQSNAFEAALALGRCALYL